MSIADVAAGTDSCVTSICSEGNDDVIFFGCGDHRFRRMDLRSKDRYVRFLPGCRVCVC